MVLAQLILHNLLSFVFITSLIVFIHEFGHFYVARLCGVKVNEFSIGFGKELLGFFDKKGTRWKFCLLPFGGYVKMYGDRNGASMPDLEEVKNMSEEDHKKSFIGKNVWQRMAIVFAGPFANFLLTILIFTILFKMNGLNTISPVIDDILPQSAALEASLKKGDIILEIDGKIISNFDEVRESVIGSTNNSLFFKIKRDKEVFEVNITPKIQSRKDFFGDDVEMRTIGISASEISHQDLNLWQSFVFGNKETYKISITIFKTIGELITGQRSVKELGGPIKIAKYSGKTVDMGLTVVLWFVAMISVNLGVMNLLPIPVLDGGHLFYYFIEAIRKKPLPENIQKIGFKIGLGLVLALMIFTTVNDIEQLVSG